MKVICAGYPKTGTKSMQAALTELGYNDYDAMENFAYLQDDWIKIFKEGGTTEDFRRMFENVDAVTDVPAAAYWDEIHKAFPEAKIVLTMRDDEDTWAESMSHQLKAQNNRLLGLIFMLSPTYWKLKKYGDRMLMACLGSTMQTNLFGPIQFNMALARMKYRRHNAHVLQNAPKDKLLVYNVKEGWEPLCKFLGVEVPSKPFPRRNVKGSIVKEFMKKDPTLQRIKREVIGTLLLLLSCGLGFKFAKESSISSWYQRLLVFPKLVWK